MRLVGKTPPRRFLALASAVLLGLIAGAFLMVRLSAPNASGAPFSFNWTGTPSTPLSVVPGGWDTQIHSRGPGDTADPMLAQHGADCSAPPASHPVVNLADLVFICNNHLMTAINDSSYGEIALTPDHLVDFSGGTTTITVQVSTQQISTSDWIELWITPFLDSQTLPFDGQTVDMQGPPRSALRFSLNHDGVISGSLSGDVVPFSNYAAGATLPKAHCQYDGDPACVGGASGGGPPGASAVVRTTYEIDISPSHIRFGLPTQNVWWTDTNFAAPFTQGVVTLAHHTYDSDKHCGCGNDTWHWSNFSISNAVPFTIINGNERSIHVGGPTTIHFPAPAPANAYLRFSGIGNAIFINGSPAMRVGPHFADEHFQSYLTPIPAGTTSVAITGVDWYGDQWWVRDPAIWSLSTGGAPSPTPSTSPAPSRSPSPSAASSPTAVPSPSPSPAASPSPSPSPIPISGAPCTVTISGVQQAGTCTGSFQPGP